MADTPCPPEIGIGQGADVRDRGDAPASRDGTGRVGVPDLGLPTLAGPAKLPPALDFGLRK